MYEMSIDDDWKSNENMLKSEKNDCLKKARKCSYSWHGGYDLNTQRG